MVSLHAIRGDDFLQDFYWRPGGQAADLTGYTVEFSVTFGGTTTTYTTTPEVTVVASEGKIQISIDDAVTATWPARGRFRLRVTSSTDYVTTLTRGELLVS